MGLPLLQAVSCYTCFLVAEGCCLQLRGRNLLPFGQLRQNLLAVCMDYLGFNLAANTAFIVIEHVSTAQDWDNSQGQLGVVNVTLLTISDNNEALFGLVSPKQQAHAQ